MRHRFPLRVTSASSIPWLYLVMALLPSLWISGWAPVARGVVLPTLAVLTLVLLLPRTTGDRAQQGEETTRSSIRNRRSSFLSTPTAFFSAFLPIFQAVAAHPALLYLGWAALCAARTVGTLSLGRGVADAAMPSAADFARGELLRLTAGVAIYLVVASTGQRWERARQMVDALLWAVIGATVMAFVTHSADDPALVGPFGNAQLLAAVLVLLSPLAIVVAMTARDRLRRTVSQVATVLALAALALAQTRSAWLGGLVAFVALAFLLARLPRRRRTRWDHRTASFRPDGVMRIGGPPLAAGLLALAALGWLVCHSDLTGPVSERAATLTRLSDDEGASWRFRQWRVALTLAREHPWTGSGLGSYPLAAAPRLPQPIPVTIALAIGPNLALNAHSFYLQTLAETGAVGLGLYLWTIAAFFRAGVRACRHGVHPFRSLVLAACMAGVIGQIIDSLANPAYQFTEVSLFFWAILGLGTAMAQATGRRSVAQSDPDGDGTFSSDARFVGHDKSPVSQITSPSSSLLPYPLRLAAVFSGAAVLAAGAVSGSPPPLNQAVYMPLRTFRVVALTTPGYLLQTLLPGECVEMRGIGTLYSDEEADATAECTFSRAGGTAPAEGIEQLAAPNANLFCVPTSVPPECDGRTVVVQGTFSFNGQTLTALGPPLGLSVPRAAPGTFVMATPRVISPTGEMVEIQLQVTEAGIHFQRLMRVDANEPLTAGDAQIIDDTHVMLRAASTVPDRRIYTIRCRFRDRRNRTWMAPVQVYVR